MKKIFALPLLAFTLIAFAGCEKREPAPEKPAPTEPEKVAGAKPQTPAPAINETPADDAPESQQPQIGNFTVADLNLPEPPEFENEEVARSINEMYAFGCELLLSAKNNQPVLLTDIGRKMKKLGDQMRRPPEELSPEDRQAYQNYTRNFGMQIFFQMQQLINEAE